MDARHLCTVVLARDYPKLVDWYRRVLKLKIRHEVEEGYRCTELARPGLRILLAPAKDMGVKLPRRPANAVLLHLVTPDVRRFLRKMKAAGARVSFGPSFNPERGFWYGAFRDLEDNEIWVIDPRGAG